MRKKNTKRLCGEKQIGKTITLPLNSYPDVCTNILARKPAYVIEFKIADKFNQLEKRAEDALLQIEEKGYARELQDDGYATVIKYGIAFMGKDCVVKMQE